MFDWLRTRGGPSTIKARYGLVFDDPDSKAPAVCHYEACITRPENLDHLPGGFVVKRLPYGTYACAHDVGNSAGIMHAISQFRTDWSSNAGVVSDTVRPLLEIFLDAPSEEPVDRQRIDICFPVMFPVDSILLAPHDTPTTGAERLSCPSHLQSF